MNFKKGDFVRLRENSPLGRALGHNPREYLLRVLGTQSQKDSNISPTPKILEAILLDAIEIGYAIGCSIKIDISRDRYFKIEGLTGHHYDQIEVVDRQVVSAHFEAYIEKYEREIEVLQKRVMSLKDISRELLMSRQKFMDFVPSKTADPKMAVKFYSAMIKSR